MTAPHVHACQECDPTLKPSEVRESDEHFGVQFGHRHHRPFLNGEEVAGVAEAMVGENGWVLRYYADEEGKKHLCPRHHQQVCVERVSGTVRVEEMVPA